MHKSIPLAALLLAATQVGAQVAPTCSLAWDYDAAQEYRISGFKMYNQGILTWTGTAPTDRTVTCVDAGLSFGSHSIYVTAYNLTQESLPSNTVDFTVEEPNRAPIITSTPPTSGEAGALYVYDVTATDADNDPLVYSLTTQPAGMGIDPASGMIEWTPHGGQTGSHPVTVQVADPDGATAIQSWQIAVALPPDPGIDCTDAACLWDDTAVPEVFSTTDPAAIEVGLKFEALVEGSITGVRFYKGALNLGLHTGRVYTADGQILAQVEFANETAEGWQTAYFDTPVPIVSLTTYVVSVHMPQGGYSYDLGYFLGQDYLAGEIRAHSNEESGGNMVHVYSDVPAFPTEAGVGEWAGTNFWVGPVFNNTPVPLPPPFGVTVQ